MVRRSQQVRMQAFWVGLAAAVLVGATGGTLLDGSVFFGGLLFVWPPVGATCQATMSPDSELVEDAEAVLNAWEGSREEWAPLAVAEVSADAAEETAAWARTNAEKSELLGSSASSTSEVQPGVRGDGPVRSMIPQLAVYRRGWGWPVEGGAA
jgi:hypothetical protein